jgi:hypothetical protein
MNGFIGKTLAAAGLAASLAGCCGYYDMVDPCYPQRYNFAARTEVCGALTPQVKNGHVLDQTIWNWMFKEKEDQLNAAGQAKLLDIVRRRPVADPMVFLATAHDLDGTYDPANPGALATARAQLDQRRRKAVEDYLNEGQTGGTGAFVVQVHDPAEPYLPAGAINGAIRTWYAGWGGAVGQAGGAALGGAGGR